MALDEQVAELHQRKIFSRTNAVIAKNVALDGLRSLERTLGELRRKLDHDELESLDQGGTIPYMGLFGTTAFDIERNLVRLVHFLSDIKVAQFDLDELMKAKALGELVGPIPIRGLQFKDPRAAADHVFWPPGPHQVGFNENNCGLCGFKPEWHPLRAPESATEAEVEPKAAEPEQPVEHVKEVVRGPYIDHPFKPKNGAWQYCDSTYEDTERDVTQCGARIEVHKVVFRCGKTKNAHSIHPSALDGPDSAHGHEYKAPEEGDKCQHPIQPSVDLHSHSFQAGNGSKCTYSSYGMECGGTRRDHQLL